MGVGRSETASILPFYPSVPGQPKAVVTPWLTVFPSSLYPPCSLPIGKVGRLGVQAVWAGAEPGLL